MNNPTIDCGCGGKTPAAAKPAAAHEHANTSGGQAPAGPTDAQPSGTKFVDGFRALNPADGLFLTAEHLNVMQEYARSLTVALATATGPGVVHGLGVTLSRDAKSIVVSPGLAITPHGQPLLLRSEAPIPLEGNLPTRQVPDGFWRIELHPASDTSGSAPVYGSLCNDGCADGTGAAIQQWRDEGVEIRFVQDTMSGLDAADWSRRNWLASMYFERERVRGGPWLTPTGEDKAVRGLSSNWDDATQLPAEAGVPLALLQQPASGYILDMWAARRLVDGPQASATWRNRLAMRPWSVFLAQILQFQDELTGDHAVGIASLATGESEDLRHEAIQLVATMQRFFDTCKDTDLVQRRATFQHAKEAAANFPIGGLPDTSKTAAPSNDFVELPPAGYLPIAENDRQLDETVDGFFRSAVDFHTRKVRADQVADEVMAAQHRDRIPLTGRGTDRRPSVDILVPTMPADKRELHTDAYRCVAFVRRGIDPESPPVPEVPRTDTGVYLYQVESSPWLSRANKSKLPTAIAQEILTTYRNKWQNQPIGMLSYPRGSWSYPGNDAINEILKNLSSYSRHGILSVASNENELPLAAWRGSMLGASLDSGYPLPVYALVDDGQEAIVIVAQEKAD